MAQSIVYKRQKNTKGLFTSSLSDCDFYSDCAFAEEFQGREFVSVIVNWMLINWMTIVIPLSHQNKHTGKHSFQLIRAIYKLIAYIFVFLDKLNHNIQD